MLKRLLELARSIWGHKWTASPEVRNLGRRYK